MNLVAYFWMFCALVYVESASYFFRLHRRSSVNRISALLLLWIGIYAVLTSLSVSSGNRVEASIFTKLYTSAGAFVGPFAFHFMITISRHERILRNRLTLSIFYVVPILFAIYTLVATDTSSQLYQTQWGWDLSPGSNKTIWDYMYFLYACLAMFAGLILIFTRAFMTNERLERRQMLALTVFGMFGIAGAVIASLYGVNGSVRYDIGRGVLMNHFVTIALLLFWLLGLRVTNWRFKLLVRLPETFAGNLLSTMKTPLFLVDRENVIIFANSEASTLFENALRREAKLEGRYFNELFKNGGAVSESVARLRQKVSEHESCVVLVAPQIPPGSEEKLCTDRTVRITILAIFDEKSAYVGSLILASPTNNLDQIRKRSNLTNREIEVLLLIDQGFRTREISQALYISELTAKTHIHNIYQKIGARTRIELSKISLGLGSINSICRIGTKYSVRCIEAPS